MNFDLQFVQTFATGLIAAATVFGFFLALNTIRSMNRQREVDLLMRLYEKMHGTELEEARKKTKTIDYSQIDDFTDFPLRRQLNQVLNFLETIAIMVRRHYLHQALVKDTMLNILIDTVDQHKPYIDFSRKEDPTYYEHLVWLANKLRPLKHPAVRPKGLIAKIKGLWS